MAATSGVFHRMPNPLVVAIGLGGPEAGYPRTQVAPFFERARRAGYAAVACCGCWPSELFAATWRSPATFA